jgi:RNA polymerase sigma-32 factor
MLAKAYLENQDLNAAHRLVTSHLKLVAKIALSFRNYGIPTNELISEGNLGLMHAVKKFNPDLGYRLSTYAMWWIKASIQEYILKSWSLVKIGTTAAQKKLFFSLNKIKNKIRNSNSREIIDQDYQDIADDLGVEKSEVIEMDKRLSRSDISLNSPSNNFDENSSELIEYIPEARPSHELVLSSKQESSIRRELLLKALQELNEREFVVIQERRLKDTPSTLEDLSLRFGISKERVRQIENKAFEKIQKYILHSS